MNFIGCFGGENLEFSEINSKWKSKELQFTSRVENEPAEFQLEKIKRDRRLINDV